MLFCKIKTDTTFRPVGLGSSLASGYWGEPHSSTPREGLADVLHRPVYTQIQVRVHFKKATVIFLEKLEYFQSLATVLSINVVFATMGCRKVRAAILVAC